MALNHPCALSKTRNYSFMKAIVLHDFDLSATTNKGVYRQPLFPEPCCCWFRFSSRNLFKVLKYPGRQWCRSGVDFRWLSICKCTAYCPGIFQKILFQLITYCYDNRWCRSACQENCGRHFSDTRSLCTYRRRNLVCVYPNKLVSYYHLLLVVTIWKLKKKSRRK